MNTPTGGDMANTAWHRSLSWEGLYKIRVSEQLIIFILLSQLALCGCTRRDILWSITYESWFPNMERYYRSPYYSSITGIDRVTLARNTIARRREFRRLILRELQELTPFPEIAKKGKDWYDHQRKDFIHHKIFDAPLDNRDFILSLPPDMVYDVSQLWSALKNRDAEQWLHFLDKLSNPGYDKNGEIKKAYRQWDSLINEYKRMRRSNKSKS